MGIAAVIRHRRGNAAGPVMSIYLISHGMVKNEFMGTWSWFFLIVNLSKLPVVAGMGMMTAETLRFSLFMVAFLVLGGWWASGSSG